MIADRCPSCLTPVALLTPTERLGEVCPTCDRLYSPAEARVAVAGFRAPRRRWTAPDLRAARTMLGRGASLVQIGAQLRRSPKGVAVRLHRTGR